MMGNQAETDEDYADIKVEDSVSVMARDLTDTNSETVSSAYKQSNGSLYAVDTYRKKPNLDDKFKVNPVREVINQVLTEILTGQVYDSRSAITWTTNIANKIHEKVKDLHLKRYKHIVQVMVGEMNVAGVNVGCVWDAETQGYTTDTFINDTIFSVVVVFAVYDGAGSQEEESRKAREASTVESGMETSTIKEEPTEEALLERALAMSMEQGESAQSQSTPSVDFANMTEEEQIAFAMQMSMQDAQETASFVKKEEPMEVEGDEDYSEVMNDPAFLLSVLENLPGIDPHSETIRQAVSSLKDKKKDDKDDKQKK